MLQPKPHIQKLIPGIHGGINYPELKEMGIPPENVLDFSVSTNPFGPPPGTREALSQSAVGLYPDSESSEFRYLLAGRLEVNPDCLLTGSGSTELIRLITAAYFGPDDTVLIPQPTYGDYEVACHLTGAAVLKQPVAKGPYFQLDIAGTVDLIHKNRPKGIFICNPNNPTGQYLSREEIEKVLSAAPDSLVVLDEAYIAFTEETWSSLELIKGNNLVVLRSMTKDYGLAGLRLGYAAADSSIISLLKRIKPPWNVSSAAQAAGTFVLNAGGYIENSRVKIREAKDLLVKELTILGLPPVPSKANFFLVRIKHVADFRRALLKKGILVRDCSSFGLPGYIRLAPRSIEDCRKLLTAIKTPEVYSYAR
jgi:histidinol-phosphate aminotransferase